MSELAKAQDGTIIQAFPLQEGYVSLTSGTYSSVSLVGCVADGDVTITWRSGETDTLSCVGGDCYSLINALSVEVVSGTFHLGI